METESTKPFVFLQRYRVAVCVKCGLAELSREVLSHLRERHRDIDVPRRTRLTRDVSSWPNVIQDQAGLLGFVFPPTTSYIPQLAAPRIGRAEMSEFPYTARQLQKIQGHCRDHHGWVNSRRADRPGRKRKKEPLDAPNAPEPEPALP